MKAPRLRKGQKNATTPISSLCCIPRMATYRREDLEVIWPAPPKPSTQRAASGTRTVLASLRLHVSSQPCVHIGDPRPSQSSPSRLIHGCVTGLWSEMLPRWSEGASPCFYCLEDRKETEVSLCRRRMGLQLCARGWQKCMMGKNDKYRKKANMKKKNRTQ